MAHRITPYRDLEHDKETFPAIKTRQLYAQDRSNLQHLGLLEIG